MTDTCRQPTGFERAPDEGIEPRDDVEITELANLDVFHLRHERNQDVSAFLVWEFHGRSAKGAAVPAPVLGFAFQQWHAGGLHPSRAALNLRKRRDIPTQLCLIEGMASKPTIGLWGSL